MAEELLKLYAARKAVPGHAFSPDSHWQQEFEDAFEYELTRRSEDGDRRHQARHGIADADGPPALRRRRLRQDRSRDARRVQGGDGRQAGRVPRADDGAGVSAPEDAEGALRRLSRAHRHGEPLPHARRSRRRRSPISPPARSTSSSARTGCCRRTSQFRDLGLLVVDEEQRFGVAHKEKIKQLRKKVDVLTMSATPIPRTLNMSLVGIRDMSIIETPPKDRLSIQTNVVKFDQQVIGRAIRNELARGGQVYFVHNRVESIFSIGSLIQRLVPEARVVVGHGQMGEDALERAMLDFVAQEVRRPAGDDDRRERPRHSERQHDHHQPRRSLRPVAALSAARPRRPIRSAGVRVPADSAGRQPVAGREEAARRDQGVQRSRQRLPRGGARPRDPRRRQPARRRAERAHRGRRLRDVHEAARADRPRAEGRGARRRRPRDGEPARRSADRRVVRAGHEPAADALPQGRRRAARGRDRSACSRRRPTATARCPIRCSTWPTTAASASWPTGSASRPSTAKAASSS